MAPRSLVAVLASLSVFAVACSVTVSVEAPADSEAATNEPAGDTAGNLIEGPESGGVAFTGRFTWTDAACDFIEPAGVASDCGWLEVPERWDDPADGDTIRLHVGIFSAGPSDAEPLVYLEGGPGADALANIGQAFDAVFGAIVDSRDVIVLGQRGTGSAEPELACPNVTELGLELLDEPQSAAAELEAFTQPYVQCAGDLRGAGIDPGAYNSVQNAHDVEALRRALGHERWNVLGISYGTRLAQSLMRLHPDGIRSVVLDSVLAYERAPTLDIPMVAKRAFDTLFAACAAAVECSGRWPDLETRFFDLVAALDAEPIFFEVANVIDGRRFPASLDGDGLLNTAFGALYTKSGVSALPELVEQLEAGETAGVETLVSQDITTDAFIAEGMYWSVECHEEVPFVDLAGGGGRTGDPRYDRLQPEGYDRFITAVCDALAPGRADPVEDELLVSDIPALLLAGNFDPITPPADTESLLAGLTNGQYVEFPHAGHAVMAEECGQEIAVAFLADPAAAVDTACVATTDEPAWSIDLFADISFEPFEYDAGFYSASGVAPVGWESDDAGTFVQGDNSLHVSVIVQQVVAGDVGDLLADTLGDVLGVDPVEGDTREVGGTTFRQFEADTPGSIIDMFIGARDGETLLLLLQHAPADHDAALEALVAPLLEALGS